MLLWRPCRDGSARRQEQLAGLLAERDDRNGIYELRTLEDVRRSAQLVLALTSPHYESGFRLPA